MKCWTRCAVVLLAVNALCGVAAAQTRTNTADITVQGVLQDAAGNPATGERAWRVVYFDAPVAGNQMGTTVTGTVTLEPTGRFSFPVRTSLSLIQPPRDEYSQPGSAYYELAIDCATPPDGVIDPEDVFPERVRVTSVLLSQHAWRSDWSAYALNADTLDGQHGSYYAKARDLTDGLATKANVADTYTKRQVDTALAGKSDTDHGHAFPEITGLATDGQIPNTITISSGGSVDAGALKSGVVPSARLDLGDNDIPDGITIDHATTAGHADTSTSATWADESLIALLADRALAADSADESVQAEQALAADVATTATHADTATTASVALALRGFDPATKSDVADVYAKSETYSKTEIDTALADKSNTGHDHDLQDLSGAVTDAQVPDDITIDHATSATLAATADTAVHADTATTASVALALLGFDPATKSDVGDAYAKSETYSKTEVDTALAGKSDTGHAHAFSEITGSATDAQVPDAITISSGGSVDAAALKSGTVPSARLSLTDADIPDTITVDLATSATFADTATTATHADTATTASVALSAGALEMADGVPDDSTSHLYNFGGELFWDGAQIVTADAVSVDKNEINDSGLLPFDWANSEVADDLTISSSGSVDAGALKSGTVPSARLSLGDSDVPDALTLSGGTINNSPIGATTASTGKFTSLAADALDVREHVAIAGAVTAPTTTTERLYNTGGDLFWSGAQLLDAEGGLASAAAQYVVAQLDEGNSDTENGAALLAAYAKAKTLNPSAANRIAVVVPPGRYDLGAGALTLDTEYISLVGLTTDRAAQYIYGTSNGSDSGVLMQTADNVRIENLTVECTRSPGGLSTNATAPAAYWPNVSWMEDSTTVYGSGPNTVIRNCEFIANATGAWSIRIGTNAVPSLTWYAGFYEDVVASGPDAAYSGDFAFGGYGTASGTFTNCTGGNLSFGGNYGTASGAFTDCTGGNYAFAGGGGTASGTFINCTGGEYAFGGTYGTASGAFTDCTGGDYAFGGKGGTASGAFTDCTGGNYAFAGDGGTASGTFTDCTGGDRAFGGFGGTAGPVGDGPGIFKDCTGGDYAFGGGSSSSLASGTFTDCRSTGYGAFGGDGGTASGAFTNCTGYNNCFGGGSNGIASGVFTNCSAGEFSFGGPGSGEASGEFRDCIGGQYAFSGGMNSAPYLGGTASGVFTNCEGGYRSFGGGGGSTTGGSFFWCRAGGDSMYAGGNRRYCDIDGTATND